MLKYIFFAIIVVGFLYWRGADQIIKQRKIDCQWQQVILVCSGTDKDALANFPSFVNVIKAGAKF